MSLVDLLNELDPVKPDGVSEEPPKLEGTIEGGKIKLDATDLSAVGARLKWVRQEIAKLNPEADRLRKLVLAHPEAKEGYSDPNIYVDVAQELVVEDPKLIAALIKSKRLNDALDIKISATKVRELAKIDPEIKAAMRFSPARRICVNDPASSEDPDSE